MEKIEKCREDSDTYYRAVKQQTIKAAKIHNERQFVMETYITQMKLWDLSSANNERERADIHPQLIKGEKAVREKENEETKCLELIEHSQELINGYRKAIEMRDEKLGKMYEKND